MTAVLLSCNRRIKIQVVFVCCFEPSLRFKFWRGQPKFSSINHLCMSPKPGSIFIRSFIHSAEYYRGALFYLQPRYRTAAGSLTLRPKHLILRLVARHRYNFFLFNFAWTSSLFLDLYLKIHASPLHRLGEHLGRLGGRSALMTNIKGSEQECFGPHIDGCILYLERALR